MKGLIDFLNESHGSEFKTKMKFPKKDWEGWKKLVDSNFPGKIIVVDNIIGNEDIEMILMPGDKNSMKHIGTYSQKTGILMCDDPKLFGSVFDGKLNESLKATNGHGCIEMIQTMIDQLKAHPDMNGKDKEIWYSAGQFLYDYLKELTEKDRKEIMDYFGLVKLSDWKEVTPQDVSLGIHMLMSQGDN